MEQKHQQFDTMKFIPENNFIVVVSSIQKYCATDVQTMLTKEAAREGDGKISWGFP